MTRASRNFSNANAASPVVYGSVLDGPLGGCFYRLADGKTFTLTAHDCRQVEPRWAFEPETEAA